MKKILFLIHDLGHGGAEKVLVNLVNNLDRTKFDISVTALFGGGVNAQFLKPDVHYRAVFPRMIPGNSHWMKLLTPKQLHRLCVRERYDIEVSYLEGPSARVISGCETPETKLISWIHSTTHSEKHLAKSFRGLSEARKCYGRFDASVFVSQWTRDAFLSFCGVNRPTILYNTNESAKILALACVPVNDPEVSDGRFRWCGVGKLTPNKGFDRMIRIQARLRQDGFDSRLLVLGEGSQKADLEALAASCGVSDSVVFLGYQTNPYKYVSKCDLFVCASHSEGFSTAATEALILGTPVCTVEVSGMKEMLGENNEWGIVTENDEDALYRGIKGLLEDPGRLAYYKEKAAQRGRHFSTEETVKAVEEMLLSL